MADPGHDGPGHILGCRGDSNKAIGRAGFEEQKNVDVLEKPMVLGVGVEALARRPSSPYFSLLSLSFVAVGVEALLVTDLVTGSAKLLLLFIAFIKLRLPSWLGCGSIQACLPPSTTAFIFHGCCEKPGADASHYRRQHRPGYLAPMRHSTGFFIYVHIGLMCRRPSTSDKDCCSASSMMVGSLDNQDLTIWGRTMKIWHCCVREDGNGHDEIMHCDFTDLVSDLPPPLKLAILINVYSGSGWHNHHSVDTRIHLDYPRLISTTPPGSSPVPSALDLLNLEFETDLRQHFEPGHRPIHGPF
ncbi:hypothetical protein C8J56DRAFT_1048652 [Mycena floridula]|nr:hypothetical protein C8J56DRAFT_1048652 [Mycena floridula]